MKSKKLLERKEKNQQNMVFQKPKKTVLFQKWEVSNVNVRTRKGEDGKWPSSVETRGNCWPSKKLLGKVVFVVHLFVCL